MIRLAAVFFHRTFLSRYDASPELTISLFWFSSAETCTFSINMLLRKDIRATNWLVDHQSVMNSRNPDSERYVSLSFDRMDDVNFSLTSCGSLHTGLTSITLLQFIKAICRIAATSYRRRYFAMHSCCLACDKPGLQQIWRGVFRWSCYYFKGQLFSELPYPNVGWKVVKPIYVSIHVSIPLWWNFCFISIEWLNILVILLYSLMCGVGYVAGGSSSVVGCKNGLCNFSLEFLALWCVLYLCESCSAIHAIIYSHVYIV
jgi:hypothetical protein